MIGDLIGKPGRVAVEQVLPGLREERGIDFVTANGENVAGGMGLTPSTAEAMFASGVDVITSGNHIWDKREIYPYLDANDRVLRPHNYGTHEVPGRGFGVYDAMDGSHIAVINLQGRTFMQPIENPFTDADALLDETSSPEPLPPIRLVDFHCELTSEKNALGLYLDGRVSVVVGTHTHIVTGDERILPGGTAYQTDLGMTGPVWSVIGFDPKTVLPRFINALPTRFEVGEGPVVFNACPDRHRSGDRPGARHRAHPAARRGVSPAAGDRPARVGRHAVPAADQPGAVIPPAPSSIDLHTHTTPLGRRPDPGRAGRARRAAAGVRLLAITDHDTLAGYRELVGRRCRAARHGPHPRRRDQRPRHPRSRPVGRRAPHPGVRDGSRRRGVRGGPGGPAG